MIPGIRHPALGEGVENSKVWDVFGEFHTPFKFVFRGRTRFCIERTLPERLVPGTARCALWSEAASGALALTPPPPTTLRLPADHSPLSAMPVSLCPLYTLGGSVEVSTLYYDDKTDPDKSYAPRSRAYIDGLVARARR